MGKKKEEKRSLLADADDDDGDDSEPENGFGTLKDAMVNVDDDDDGDTDAFTSQTFTGSFDDDDDIDDNIGESFRSTSSSNGGGGDSNHSKRMSRTRTSQRRSMRNLTQSPGGLSSSGRSTRRCDRTRQDRNKSPGAISRKSATASPGTLTRKSATTSPGALSRHSINGPRGASNSPHHLRRGPRSRRRSMEANDSPNNDNSAHSCGIEKGSGSQRSSSRRSKMGSNAMGTSMRMLYSGHASADELTTPDLDDHESDHQEFAEDNIASSDDDGDHDAEVVLDELADLEGLIQAAKIK
ncbi:unnamed protein product [Cylindrotheca closterium]|uniref:Uncharacterized protein n=1 Tax=Cylindrotheca closterium TaxID=2856 RepID=A0AAD2CN69_9STRA|nr:unnamed protein product [Cylindrotheca closterium]